MQNELLAKATWMGLLANVANDDSVAYAVEKLVRWIAKESSWEKSVLVKIGQAFGEHLVGFLQSEDDIWPISVQALSELATTLLLLNEEITSDQKHAFAQATRIAVGVAVENLQDAETLRAEAMAVRSIGYVCEVDFSTESERLDELAQEREQATPDDEGADFEANRYSANEEVPFDSDSLFRGLLDR
jgi:hypothetical protein